MEKLRIEDLEREPGRLAQYFGSTGALIVDSTGEVLAEVPPAIEPVQINLDEVEGDDADKLALADSDWLD